MSTTEKILATLNKFAAITGKVPLLNKLPPDKQLHVVGAAVVWVVVFAVTRNWWMPAVAVILLSAIKEWVYDIKRQGQHVVDPMDFACGAVTGMVLSAIAYVYLVMNGAASWPRIG